jgi:diguanylate cyclase (GGDEF)-like protein/PAS domain S-box-containing protein
MANPMKMRDLTPTSIVPAQAGWRQAFAAQAKVLLPNPADLDATIREIDAAIAGFTEGRRFSEVVIEMESALQRRFGHDPQRADALLAHALQALAAIAITRQADGSFTTPNGATGPDPAIHPIVSVPDDRTLTSSAVGIAVISLDDTVIATNRCLLDILGLQDVNVVGTSGLSLIGAPGDTIERMYPVDGEPQSLAFQATVLRPDGTSIWISIDCVPAVNHDLGTAMVLAIVQDVTARQQGNTTPRHVEERVHALFENTSDIVAICRDDGIIDYVSDSAERILGYPPDSLIGSRLLDIVTPDGRLVEESLFTRLLESPGNTADTSVRVAHANGSWRWMDVTLTNMSDIPAVGGVVITARDVTKRKTFEQELERLAYYDTLTGLPNRIYFRERLDAAIAALESCESPIAVVFIDLDRFKMINDRFGHDAGDSALVAVGQRILETMQDGESVARLGGDEFALLIEEATPERALATARRVLQALAQPFPEHHRFFSIDASAGVAVSSCELAAAPELLRAADIALYHGKRNGGGVATMFEASMSDAAYQRAELERNLQHALDRHEMEPWFQPEYDLATGELRGLEVLMRWRTSEGEIVQPADFIEVAIEMGIIIPLGLQILREACDHVVHWNAAHPDDAPVSLSFNVSQRELHQPDYPAKIAGILGETRLEPGLLGVEVDDSVFREHTAELDRFVEAIRTLGARLVLDGFSGGHASLPEIKRVRPDRIKIARRAIGESGSHQIDVAILNVVTTIARSLDVPVTAVGLADGSLIDQARDAGCHRAQCDLLQPPVPAEEVPAILGVPNPRAIRG